MKKRRIDLNEEEITMIRCAIKALADQNEEAMELWTQNGEDPPEYYKIRCAELDALWTKLLSL